MKKWLTRILIALLALTPVGVWADYTATQGSGSTVFAFVCSTTKICPAFVLIDSTNVEKATAGNPVRTDPTGTTTQPVSAASLPLPTGASTSALQTTGNTSVGNIDTNTGAIADAAVTAGATGSASAKLRSISRDVMTTNTWAGGTLGAMANYGTSPGAVLVPGINAFVTNSNANGRAVSGSSSPVVPTPALSTWHLINATGTNATSVKGSAATVFSCQLGSIAGPAFLKIYNKATAPTVGTDTPVKTLIIPVAATAANGAGSNISFGPGGLTLSTGFAAALTTGITVADTGSTTASTLAINCDYE